MADKPYYTVAGFVQKFGDKPAIETREVSGQNIREFTVKAIGTQKLVRITLWPEFNGVTIDKGLFVVADGKFSTSEGTNGRQFYNLSATELATLRVQERAERDTVNSGGGSRVVDTDSAPF